MALKFCKITYFHKFLAYLMQWTICFNMQWWYLYLNKSFLRIRNEKNKLLSYQVTLLKSASVFMNIFFSPFSFCKSIIHAFCTALYYSEYIYMLTFSCPHLHSLASRLIWRTEQSSWRYKINFHGFPLLNMRSAFKNITYL